MPSDSSSEHASAAPLPAGRHNLAREIVLEHQHARLVAAMGASLAARGYAKTTVAHVIRKAGVSRATFYEHFHNKRECLLVAHEVAFERLMEGIRAACAEIEGDWPERVRAGIGAVVAFCANEPELSRLVILDAVAADPVVARRVVASNDSIVAMMRAGRTRYAPTVRVPELTEQAVVGAISSIVGARLVSGASLANLEAELACVALMPYVGIEAAKRVAGGNGKVTRAL